MIATNKFGMSSRKYPEKDSLYLKFQGPSQSAIAETADIAKKIAEKHGGTGFALAGSEKEAEDLWNDRKVL
jgi:D-lactate dehydrogenase (cytochrome)